MEFIAINATPTTTKYQLLPILLRCVLLTCRIPIPEE